MADTSPAEPNLEQAPQKGWRRWMRNFGRRARRIVTGRRKSFVDTVRMDNVDYSVIRVSDIDLLLSIEVPKPPLEIETSVRKFEKRLRLRERATSNAKEQLPLTDEVELDDEHREAISVKNEIYGDVNHYIEASTRTLCTEIENRRVPELRQEDVTGMILANWGRVQDHRRKELTTLYEYVIEATNELSRFRNDNKLKYKSPDEEPKRNNAVMWVSFILLLETGLNTFFFYEPMKGHGKAFAVALIFVLFNAGLAYIAAVFGMALILKHQPKKKNNTAEGAAAAVASIAPQLRANAPQNDANKSDNAYDRSLRLFGYATFIIFSGLVLLGNGLFAHLRQSLDPNQQTPTIVPGTAIKSALHSLFNDPGALDVPAYAVGLFGILVYGFIVYKYRSGINRIPATYRRLWTQRRRHIIRFDKAMGQVRVVMDRWVDEQRDEITGILYQLFHAPKPVKEACADHLNKISGFQKDLRQIKDFIEDGILTYRQENVRKRKKLNWFRRWILGKRETPPPSYFADLNRVETMMGKTDIRDAKEEIEKELKTFEANIKQAQELMLTILTGIAELADQAQTRFSAYEKEVQDAARANVGDMLAFKGVDNE